MRRYNEAFKTDMRRRILLQVVLHGEGLQPAV